MKRKLVYGMLLALCPGMMMAYDTPTMGWSSWNTYGFKINEDVIKSQTDAMVEKGLKDAGYQYINIDDGFFGGRDENGKLLIHPTRFPNGLRPLVDYIHSKGLKAGIYSDAGKNTCASYWGGDTWGIGVGLYGHDQQDMDLYFKELNFDFIKVDFCGGDPNHNVDKLDLPEEERYRAIQEAILNTGRTDVRLNVCRWAFPGTWVHDVATSWRVSEDIYLGWNSVKGIIAQSLYLSAFATEGHYNDMDMLEVGRGLTEEEDKTHFGMWCIMSSPLLIGCDMTTIPENALKLLTNKELIALNQDPLGLQAYVVNRHEGTYVLVKDVETLHGRTRAVALYNPTDAAKEMTVDFLDLDLGGKVAVRDLYEQQDLGEKVVSMSVNVPAHGTRIYRLEAEKRYERTRYEGETAWLDAYQELLNNQSAETGIFEEADYCSGGAKAGWLGKSEKNDLQWRNVYSAEGGNYTMRLSYICGENRNLYVTVNGGEPVKLTLNSGGWSTVAEKDVNIQLNAGENVIRLYNAENWMPDIDGMTLIKENSLENYQHQLENLLLKAQLTAEEEMPEGVKTELDKVMAEAGQVEETAESYEAAIASLEEVLNLVEVSQKAQIELTDLMAYSQEIIANSDETEAVGVLNAALAEAADQLGKLNTADGFNQCITDVQNAVKAYLTSDVSKLSEGKTWDMAILMKNPDFDTDASGWVGAPAVSNGVAEHYSKNFTTYQVLNGLKNGTYRLVVSALYRTGENDGGEAYKNGTEKIPAKITANEVEIPVMSLYAWPYEGSAEGLGDLDLKNGYINSMYAASLSFADGHYENELEVKVTDGRLKIGLSNNGYQWDCWCCFDNFRLTYLGDEEGSGVTVTEADNNTPVNVYSVTGVLLKSHVMPGEALDGLPAGTYIVGNRKVMK